MTAVGEALDYARGGPGCSACRVMRCRPGGTATFGPVGFPSMHTVTSGGSEARVTCASVSAATAIVGGCEAEGGKEVRPARAMSTVRAATPANVNVR